MKRATPPVALPFGHEKGCMKLLLLNIQKGRYIGIHTAEANYFRNMNVFMLDLKDGRVSTWRSDKGREFQLEGPVNVKALWPAVVSLVRGTLKVSVGGRAESSGGGIELEAVREVCGGCLVDAFEASIVNFVLDSIRNGQPVMVSKAAERSSTARTDISRLSEALRRSVVNFMGCCFSAMVCTVC